MTNTRDLWSEQVFQRWLTDRVYKYEGITFDHYRHDAELGLIEGLEKPGTVSDTVTGAEEPEQQEDEQEDSGPSSALENGSDNPAEGTGPWEKKEGARTDGAGVRPSPVQEALGKTRERPF